MVSPTLYKTIFQVRYKADLKFYELFIPAAKQMKEYPHWYTTRLTIILQDFEKHCNLTITHNSFSYEQDSNDVEMETKYINNALRILPTALQIESFIRFGYRRRYLIHIDFPFESLVQTLYIKLLSQDNKLRELLPSTLKDLSYRIDSEEESYKYHILIGPISKQEIPYYIGFNIKQNLYPETSQQEYEKIIQKYPDVAIFVDIDLYQEGEKLPVKETTAFVASARNKVTNLTNELCNYLLETKLE